MFCLESAAWHVPSVYETVAYYLLLLLYIIIIILPSLTSAATYVYREASNFENFWVRVSNCYRILLFYSYLFLSPSISQIVRGRKLVWKTIFLMGIGIGFPWGSIDNYHLISITDEIGNPFNYQCINANIILFINQQAMGDPVKSLREIQDCRVHRHSPVNGCHQTISRRN